jgi:hypothetical protein
MSAITAVCCVLMDSFAAVKGTPCPLAKLSSKYAKLANPLAACSENPAGSSMDSSSTNLNGDVIIWHMNFEKKMLATIFFASGNFFSTDFKRNVKLVLRELKRISYITFKLIYTVGNRPRIHSNS